MVNYIAKFVSHLAERAVPFRRLTHKDEEFKWTPEAERSFVDLKQAMRESPALQHFRPELPTVLSADASSHGLGACLLQEGRPVAYATATLTPTQQRYAQIEKELLAIVYGCEHFWYYLHGSPFVVQTDHRPLLRIVQRDIAPLSPRLQRMMMRLLRFDFKLEYVPGKHLHLADGLSRAPSDGRVSTDEMEGTEATVYSCVTLSAEATTDFKRETKADLVLRGVRRFVSEGWPDSKAHCPILALPYWEVRDELHLTTTYSSRHTA